MEYIQSKGLTLQRKCFGWTEGQEVMLYRISNADIDIEITNYGATVVSLFTPDRQGKKSNIVAGFNTLEPYTGDHPYLGCVVGRYANRIANGRFTLEGMGYQLPLNDGCNHLHGGIRGFNRQVWKEEEVIQNSRQAGVRFSYFSREGEEGYPGNLHVSVTYLLERDNRLSIQYYATTDKATIISLTNHSYFNLSGFGEPTILDHYLQVFANRYTVKSEQNTPSGAMESVKGSPLDFLQPRRLGDRLHELTKDGGYDHNFVLEHPDGKISRAAALTDKRSGRILTVFTDQPGIQVYTANFWDGSITGYHGSPYEKHGAIALETQAFPDSPNHPHFPSAILQPKEIYDRETVFQFSLEKAF